MSDEKTATAEGVPTPPPAPQPEPAAGPAAATAPPAAEALPHPAAAPAAAPAPQTAGAAIPVEKLESAIVDVIKTIFDPEIPVNIYEIGLIYGVDVKPDGSVYVKMTLTSPGCPAAQEIPAEVKARVESVPGVRAADVEVVWDPQWNPAMMSEAAKLQLGFL
jgi:FeS assembly SUF system protein